MNIETEERFEQFKRKAAVLSKVSDILTNELIQVEERADKLKILLKGLSERCEELQRESEELFNTAEDDYLTQQLEEQYELQKSPEYQSELERLCQDDEEQQKEADRLFSKEVDESIYQWIISGDTTRKKEVDDLTFLKALNADEKYNALKKEVGEKLAKFYFLAKKKGQYKEELKESLGLSSTQTIYDRANKLAKKGHPEIYEFLNINKKKSE